MKEKEELRKIAEYYDQRARVANGVRAAGQWREYEYIEEICEEIVNKINVEKTDRVLELGCGSGVLGNWVRKKCASYYGIDLSHGMLKKFLEEYRTEQKPNVVQSLTERVPFRDHLFNVIVMNGVTMYFSNNEILKKTLIEIERLASHRSTIFIGENIVPSGYSWELVWFQNLPGIARCFVEPYVRIRRWLVKHSILIGKWRSMHNTVSPRVIREYFKDKGVVTESDAAAYSTRKRKMEKSYKGNRRKDFVIKLG